MTTMTRHSEPATTPAESGDALTGAQFTGVQLCGPAVRGSAVVLTPEALATVAALHRRFDRRRRELLARRDVRALEIAEGAELGLLRETEAVRADERWQVAPPGPGLRRRHVEITGPVSRSMAINALNSGADVWMADLEDATSPTWANLIESQHTLIRLVSDDLDFTTSAGKAYRITGPMPTVMVRPRGWHLPEKHVRIDGQVASGSLVDIGLYFHHCARAMIERGQGPYFYLPKLESHLEARLWNDVFCYLQDAYGIPRGTVRATVLIETLPAAFEMEEILYELREHSAGLNAGRWDYIFSIIKTLHSRGADAVLPDRADVTMTTPLMRAYCERLVATCHRRGAYAIGGMSAFVPSRVDERVNERALRRAGADKARDAEDGFDGGWVAHPALVPTARGAFDAVLNGRENQLTRQRSDYLDPAELLNLRGAGGGITLHGLRANVRVSLRYLTAWLQGRGAVAIDHLMEDAATVEISRSQVWQWLRQGVRVEEGLDVTESLVPRFIAEESARIAEEAGDDERALTALSGAVEVFSEVTLSEAFADFLTLPAYERYLTG